MAHTLMSIQLLFLLAVCTSCSANGIIPYTSRNAFGVRGGAFFGFGRSKQQNNSDGSGGNGGDAPKRYPALSQAEIEERLNVPIFGLTDANGNGVILSDNGNNIFHFFFSKHMAEVALKAVSEANSGAPPLKISAFHLGKCWFKLINKSGDQEYKLQKLNEGNEVSKKVKFRLVPNMKDLMGARILTGLKPGDVESLKEAVEEPDPPKALSIIQSAANNENTSFKSPFDEIPVFAISQMRVRKKDELGNAVGNNLMPFHLSTKTMSDTWNEFVQRSPQFNDAEATLQLIELHKIIELMQSDSDFDFRNIVFIYPHYDKDNQGNNDMDDSDDDSDDGGGGDNGVKIEDDANYADEISIEPYVEMYTADNLPSQSWVQMNH